MFLAMVLSLGFGVLILALGGIWQSAPMWLVGLVLLMLSFCFSVAVDWEYPMKVSFFSKRKRRRISKARALRNITKIMVDSEVNSDKELCDQLILRNLEGAGYVETKSEFSELYFVPTDKSGVKRWGKS